MKKESKRKYQFYYLVGGILLAIGIIIIVLSITLPIALKDIFNNYQFLGWICLVFTCLGMVLTFYAFYLLKKGNFSKLNQKYLHHNNKEEQTTKEDENNEQF